MKNKSKKTILINGLGFSGSGALVDYFKEFNNIFVFADEFDVLRHSGGIFELEKIIKSQNIFLIDSGVKRFIRLVDYLNRTSYKNKKGRGYQNVFGEKFKDSAYEFLEKILLINSDTAQKYFNINENNDNSEYLKKVISAFSWIVPKKAKLEFKKDSDNKIYYAKALVEEEFVEYAKEFISNIFSDQKDNEFLLLDQAISIGARNFSENLKYFHDAKAIVVYRDPRDVYMESLIMGRGWMTSNTVPDFINWIKCMYKPLEDDNNSLLKISFEHLVLDYSNTTNKINKFVGISPGSHFEPQKYLNPKISSENVGIWKNAGNKAAIALIEKELSEFCYNGYGDS